MKIRKVILSFLIAIIMCIGMIKTSALAASDTQNGVKVDLTTDKENYKEDEKIAALLTVKNTNNTPIKNISLEISSLEGYDISDFQKQVEFLKPNESVSLKTVYSIKNVSSEVGAVMKENVAKQADSVDTGDQTYIFPGLVLLILSSICIAMKFHQRKKTGKFISLFLVVFLASTFLSGIFMKVEAADLEKNINIKTMVQIGKEQREIRGIVKYTLESTKISNNDRITREEWIAELSDVIGLGASSDGHYSYDDFKDAQFPDVIESAIRKGFVPVKPDQDNKIYFRPKEYATREFVAYTAVHALNYQLNEEKVDEWADGAEITYPKEASKAVSTQILSLIDNSFLPNRELTVREKEIALKRIAEIIKSLDNNGEGKGVVQYVAGVRTTELIYELDEINRKVYIMEPEKIAGWQAGEIHVLFSSDRTQNDIAIKIVSITQEDGWTVIHYDKPAIEEVVVSFEVEGKESTQGEFIPAEGITVENTAPREATSGSIPLFVKQTLSFEVDGKQVSVSMNLKELEYRLSASSSEKTISINEVYLALNDSLEVDVSSKHGRAIRKELGTIKVPLEYGFYAFGEIYFMANDEDGYEVGIEISKKEGIQYMKGQGLQPVMDVDFGLKSITLQNAFKAGLGVDIGVGFVGFDLVKCGTEGGLAFDETKEIINDAPMQFCNDERGYLFLDMYAQIGGDKTNLKYTYEIFNSDNSIWRKNIHVEETGIVSECTRGRGSYQGCVTEADSSDPIEHAIVQVFQGDVLKDTTYTDNEGKFVGLKLKDGTYTLRVSSSGYLPYEQDFEIIGGRITTLEPQLMFAEAMCDMTITDAYTGKIITNAEVTIIVQELNDQGEAAGVTFFPAHSGENGKCSFNLQAGTYKLGVSVEGYTTDYQTVTLDSGNNNMYYYLIPES